MKIMFLLIGLSLFIALIFLSAFFWAIKSGQYEDVNTPALRILFEDTPSALKTESLKSKKTKSKQQGDQNGIRNL